MRADAMIAIRGARSNLADARERLENLRDRTNGTLVGAGAAVVLGGLNELTRKLANLESIARVMDDDDPPSVA